MDAWLALINALPIAEAKQRQEMNWQKNMKSRIIKKSVGIFVFGALVLVGVVGSVFAQETLSGGYTFGPGLERTTDDTVRLRVPARTNVGITVELQRNLSDLNNIPVTSDINVTIEVFRPGSNTAIISQTASATVVQAGLQIPAVTVPGVFSSSRGCPDTWRVRIRTASNATPPVRVFGTVRFAFVRPGTVNLGMEGGPLKLTENSAKRTLAGYELLQLKRALIAGTGQFRIRAKWHSDIFNLGKFFRLRVQLIRPDGTTAADETGFSQHAPPGNTPKVNFTYTVTSGDAAMQGQWKVRVSNPGANEVIENFDIERGLDLNSPSFNSTFLAECSDPVAVVN